jgi:hypothetical protein
LIIEFLPDDKAKPRRVAFATAACGSLRENSEWDQTVKRLSCRKTLCRLQWQAAPNISADACALRSILCPAAQMLAKITGDRGICGRSDHMPQPEMTQRARRAPRDNAGSTSRNRADASGTGPVFCRRDLFAAWPANIAICLWRDLLAA